MAVELLLKAQHQQTLSAATRLFLSYTFKYYIPPSLTILNKAKRILAQRCFFFRLPAKPPQRPALRSGPFPSGHNSTEPHAELDRVRLLPARRRAVPPLGGAAQQGMARWGIAPRSSARTAERPDLQASCPFLQIGFFRAVKVREVSSATSHAIIY